MTKKYTGFLAGLILAASFIATPALADTNTTGSWGTDDGKTDVTVTVQPTYVVTIPATFNFTATGEQGSANNVTIAKTSQLDDAGTVSVKLLATNDLKATKVFNGGNDTSEIPFTVAYGAGKTAYTAGTETPILEKTGVDVANDNGLSTGVYVNVASFAPATTAGAHHGTLNFSVTYTP